MLDLNLISCIGALQSCANGMSLNPDISEASLYVAHVKVVQP